MVHTNTFLCAYKDETAFCSGGGATANTPTELVAANLTALDKITSFTAAIPKPVRTKEYQLASGLTPDIVHTEMIGRGKGHITAYLQTNIFYNWAVSATLGGTGTSKAFRYKSPYRTTEIDLYGSLVEHYDMEAIVRRPTMQNVDFFSTQAKTASITPIVGGINAFSTATIQTFKTYTVATVDSKTIANLKIQRVKFSVDNTFEDDEESMQLASYYSLSPVLKEREYTLEIDYKVNASETWDEDELNTTAQVVSATLTNGLFTISPVDYPVWETNQDQMDERGIITRTATFKDGVGSTQLVS